MRLRRVRLGTNEYYVWLARTSSTAVLVRLGSGPPLYVFDSVGTLVAWSPTTGDGEYPVFLGEAWRAGEPLTVENARKRIEQRASTEAADGGGL